jgi:hypothetical protein
MIKFYTAVELRELSLTASAYRDAVSDILTPILAAMETPTYTVTVDVSDFTSSDASMLKDEMIQLGYAVDDSTTPGSWIITW